MDNQNQEPGPEPQVAGSPESQPSGTPGPTYSDWREQRRAERWARREARWQRRGGRRAGWIGGAILILIGVALLLQNLNVPFVANWWALFILIPAFGAFAGAWESYRRNGRVTRGGAGSFVVGGLLTVLTLAFLLSLDVGLFWPVLLIVGGLLLLGTLLLAA
jgi:LiaF transmembrane domain